MNHTNRNHSRRILILFMKYLLAVVLIVFAVLPFLWIVSTSFNASKSLLGAHFLPSRITLDNYTQLLSSKTLNYSRWMVNSLKITVISVTIIVALTAMAAYVLSRFKFRTKNYLMMGIMILNVFPAILAMIAIYNLLRELGSYIPIIALNSHGGLIAVYVAASMSVNVLMVKAYIDTVPRELDESALVEGAGYATIFWKIIFPLVRPIIVTVGILSFMVVYGDFIIANILLKGNDNITVMVGIFKFTQERFDTDWGIVMAGTVIAAVPVLILFFTAQKHFIGGLTTGSVKQ